jgi:ribosomal protein S18 acetylase RimI-like enzyme
MAQLQQFSGVEVPGEVAFVRQFRRALVEPGFRAFVADEAGALRGVVTLWLRENLFHAGPVGLIDEVVVDEECRGQGIGSRLLQHVVDLCARLGCAEVEVSTEADNRAAQAFYAKHGFVEESVLLEREL